MQYRSIPVIGLVFLVIGFVLFAERSGIRAGEVASANYYLPEESVVTAEESAKDLQATCLLLTNKNSVESEELVSQFEQIFQDMKVGYQKIDVTDGTAIDYGQYGTVVVTFPDLSVLQENILELCDWVESGGRAMFAATIQKSNYSDLIERKLGVMSSGYENVMVESIYPTSEFMLGGDTVFPITDAFESAWPVELDDSAIVHAYTGNQNKTPLIWENPYGKGKFVVDNFGLYEKATRGFFAASYSLLEDTCVYPVINSSIFYLDDFPSPVPSGDGTYVKRDYGLDIASFYKNIWWPDMLKLAEKHGVRYTGVIIENYEDDTSDNIAHTQDTSDFQYFGNMLLHNKGELGFHGYNHQPLCLGNTQYGNLMPYNTWESYDAMRKSIAELISFGQEEYPTATMSVYVPPSNILSEEGRKMLGEDFPEIKTIASNYFGGEFAYEQEFAVAEDGIVEQPRVISGCLLEDYARMAALSELNMHLVNTHFMHPDDLLDVDRGAALGWETLKDNLADYMEWLYNAVPSIRNQTGSEGAGAIQRYAAVSVQKKETEDSLELSINHFYDEAYFLVRMNSATPGKVSGGSLEHLSGDLYLLHATEKEVVIAKEKSADTK